MPVGGALFSTLISVLTFSSFDAPRLKSGLGSIRTLGLVPPSFFLGLGRMVEVATG